MSLLSLREQLVDNVYEIRRDVDMSRFDSLNDEQWADKILEDLGVKIRTVETIVERVL